MGSSPRVDSSGWPACELCGRRLSKCKGKLHLLPPGKICSPCYKVREGYQLVTVAAAPKSPARSHKRPVYSLRHPIAPRLPSPPPPPPSPPLHHQRTFSTHGWSLQPGHRNSRALAASWMTLATSTELKSWEEKRGGFHQHSTHDSLVCSHLDELRVRVRNSSEALARSVLHAVEVDATALQLVDVKLLRAAPGQGKQEVHFDVPEYEMASQSYTVLLYLTPTTSTAVPKSPLTELRDTFTTGEEKPSRAALRKLQRDSCFHTWRVAAGDLLIFNTAVPHFGVNPDRHDRYVLFLHFSPRGLPPHDTEEQRYPHGVPSPRAKRPYEELQPTQKWKRRKKLQAEVTAVVERVGCPLEAISQPPVPPPAEVIHLSTAVREQIRLLLTRITPQPCIVSV